MSEGAFEKNNLGWQLGQWQQQFQEWLELKTSQIFSQIPTPSGFDFPLLWELVKAAFLVILSLLIVRTIWQGWQLLQPYIERLINTSQVQSQTSQPSTNNLSISGWLQRSQKLQQQGNYREACHCLYMAMLQQLNDTKLVPQQLSITDREYLQFTQSLSQPQAYETLLMTHEKLYFGNAEASPSVFEECQQAYQKIHEEK